MSHRFDVVRLDQPEVGCDADQFAVQRDDFRELALAVVGLALDR